MLVVNCVHDKLRIERNYQESPATKNYGSCSKASGGREFTATDFAGILFLTGILTNSVTGEARCVLPLDSIVDVCFERLETILRIATAR